MVFGKPTVFNNRINITHPDMDRAEELELSSMGMQPYYTTTEKMKKRGLSSRTLEKLTRVLLEKLPPLRTVLKSCSPLLKSDGSQ